MNSKLFVVFATLCALLCIQQAAGKAVEQVEQPDELYIMNPGSEFPTYVTDPNDPILRSDSRLIRFCIPRDCLAKCRKSGFNNGRCNNQAVCVCSR